MFSLLNYFFSLIHASVTSFINELIKSYHEKTLKISLLFGSKSSGFLIYPWCGGEFHLNEPNDEAGFSSLDLFYVARLRLISRLASGDRESLWPKRERFLTTISVYWSENNFT
jgi:hypothetical protein